ncbi:nuclear transport factor 2 family protein [Pantoea sp. EA-12]|uniref:nuclear transport factor 2 family protein n=1 Tax=Pantoea sp. EA-12 TaxID=3043303 RepID=UPI0024B4D14C|nr:nuclear transport factor 2 family protein [Pantoea sp. EA-12]MDI9221070.1 nuclear transport factor 2 family protein [Pantoea sp. EA-12]
MSSALQAVQVVKAFLEASMAPDPVRAAKLMSESVRITFTGKRVMATVHGVTEFNASRYRWVKKQLGDFDWMEKSPGHVVVYCTGTLYGEWPDGRHFSGNRYLDRYEVIDGQIVKMDVWNDSAEWILTPELNEA